MKILPVMLVCGSLSVGAVAGGVIFDAAPPQFSRVLGAEEVEGVITAVDLEANTFTITVAAQPTPVVLTVTDKTLYTLDGSTSTKELALKVGNKAKVTHEEKVASSVAATTPE